jgi:hypothetical protein
VLFQYCDTSIPTCLSAAAAITRQNLSHHLNPLLIFLKEADAGFHEGSMADPKASLTEPDFQIVKKLNIGTVKTDGQVLGPVLRRDSGSHDQILLNGVLAIRQAGAKLGDC